MARKGKGKRIPSAPMRPEVKDAFKKYMAPARSRTYLPGIPSHFPIIPEKINQLWDWNTLEDIDL